MENKEMYLAGTQGEKRFYHLFANGDDAKNFITSEKEFKAAFNRVGVCAYRTGVGVVSFSIEDSHPHFLLWGTFEDCTKFKNQYKSMSVRSIVQNRGSMDDVRLELELYEVTDEQYLLNVAAYTIVQPTKDGKAVMPYDYLYGTGALYFRSKYTILPWLVNEDGSLSAPVPLGSFNLREKRKICGSKEVLPGSWMVSNGFILPMNYIDVERFENIYRSCNSFRVFMGNNKKKDTEILERMSQIRGVTVEDLEARRLCSEVCIQLFRKQTTRYLTVQERILLARTLRNKYYLAFRQLSFLVHIPELELRKYIR